MSKRPILVILLTLMLAAMACSNEADTSAIPTLAHSPLDDSKTVYGFFPSPPEVSTKSVMKMYKDFADHADVVLVQQNIPWQDFVGGVDAKSDKINEIHNQYVLSRQNGLEVIFVVDPFNGLNRSEFEKLPSGWKASFSDERVIAAYTNFSLRILREFKPRYLGLASEINTYLDAHPDDVESYMKVYRQVYDAIKAEAPETQVFVTFQWEDLNNLIPAAAERRKPYQTNWDEVEAFEPRLDLWVISSYPFVAFTSGADFPADYYTPLLTRTTKPLAVAEGGYTSKPVGPLPGKPEDQVAYLNAIHSQIGPRLKFWIYLLMDDFSLASYRPFFILMGHGKDVNTLGMFESVGLRQFDGTPKPAMAVWDGFREAR